MDWLQHIIQNYLPLVSENRLIQASLIILVAFLAASLARFILNRLQVHGARKTANPIDDLLFSHLVKPLSASILLLGFHLAMRRSQLMPEQLPWIDSVLLSIGIFYWVTALIKFSRIALKHFSRDDSKVKIVQRHTLPLFDNLAVVVFYGAAIYLFFLAWDIDVTAWVASAGILGLALSFAAKDTLANLFAGVFILADTPYKIGDFIVLESGERGCVTHIGIRSTRILTRSDVEITIPNAIMGNTKVINETAGPYSKYRLRIKVGVAYGTQIQAVRDALLSVAASIELVEKDPEARVRLRAFGASSLDFELLCWVAEPVLRGKVSDLLYEGIYNLFNEEGIEIPFPQSEISIKSMPRQDDQG